MARPTIGDFRGPDDNKTRTAASPPVEEKKPPPVGEETPEAADAPEPLDLLKDAEFLTPAERYRARLKNLKIEIKDAEVIYDGVLTKGFYEEYVRFRGSRRAVLRTRMYDDHLRLQTIMEMQKPQLAISQDELITRYNLAASLYEWDGKELKHDNDDDFDAVLLLLKKMPSPIFSVLSRELAKFDEKVMAVFAEGADENFS